MSKILVIDDEQEIRDGFALILKSFGYEVSTAKDGLDGVSIHEQTPFDLIITDIFMPTQDGLETIIYLRNKYPNLKIIAISAGGGGERKYFLRSAEEFGADASLIKPISMQELRITVEAVLQ